MSKISPYEMLMGGRKNLSSTVDNLRGFLVVFSIRNSVTSRAPAHPRSGAIMIKNLTVSFIKIRGLLSNQSMASKLITHIRPQSAHYATLHPGSLLAVF